MKDASAIRHAVHVFKYPANLRHPSENRVRTGMLDLLKAAAGHEETINRLSETENVTQELVCEASKHYLRGLITDSKNNPYTTLGLSAAATPEEIKAHKRWLLKWLHPDRNPSKWEAVLFKKVSMAAEALEDTSVVITRVKVKQTKAKSILRREIGKVLHHPRRTASRTAIFVAFLKPVLFVLIVAVAASMMLKHFSSPQSSTSFASQLVAKFKDK